VLAGEFKTDKKLENKGYIRRNRMMPQAIFRDSFFPNKIAEENISQDPNYILMRCLFILGLKLFAPTSILLLLIWLYIIHL